MKWLGVLSGGLLAWSFHLGGGAADRLRSPSERVQALGDWLAADVPLRPTPLSGRHPALASYLAFLGRIMPRKGPVEAIRIARQAGMRLVMAGPVSPPPWRPM